MTVSPTAAEATDALRSVLMAVRVQGRTDANAVAAAAGVSLEAARALLDAAENRGTVRQVGDQGRWMLTDLGRAALQEMNALAAIDAARLASCYDEFVTHDVALKRAITSWQGSRSPTHLGAVRATATAAAALIERLTAIDRRYAAYARRFARACARLRAGDQDAVARSGADSVHQVWFELHEDLLVLLGRERSS